MARSPASIAGPASAPAFVALVLAWCAWPGPHRIYTLSLLGISVAVAAIGPLLTRALSKPRKPVGKKSASRPQSRLLGVGIGVAAVLGVVWGTMPIVLFASAGAEMKIFVAMGVPVLLTAGYLAGPPALLAIAFLVPAGIGASAGFALAATTTGFLLAAAMPPFTWLLVGRCRRVQALAARALADQGTVAEQNQTIRDLLLDFDGAPSDWIWETDAAGRITSLASSGMAPLPDSAAAMSGIKVDALLRSGTTPEGTDGRVAVADAMRRKRPFRNQLIRLAAKDTVHWVRLSGQPRLDAKQAFLGYRGIGTDMTIVQTSEARIAHLVAHDALTGLINRTSFQEIVRAQCAQAAEDGQCRALLSLDLDRFKAVNDRLGHRAADELLQQVAKRLQSVAPAGASIARLGGDEFALFLAPATPTKAEAVATALIETISAPFLISDLQAEIGVSIGIAYAPKHTLDPEELLVKADLALYRAKAETKGRACTFVPAFETALIERRKLEGDLKLALARGEFLLHYQPILDVALGRITMFEALIRWESPERGFVSPTDFIPAAESMGLVTPIGRWVLFEACRTAVNWPSDVHVAVNVSPPHLRSPDFLRDVAVALKTSGLHPSRLTIEVTEGVFLDRTGNTVETLKTLRTKGVRIALDDFGTGFSSLNYLIDFPVDKIKIDRSFVRDLIESETNQAIVEAILGLARKLAIRVTAEGVETKEQAIALKRRRCDELQGYLLSRPKPAGDIEHMIADVPALYRDAVPSYMDSPLGAALTARRATA